MQRAYGECAEGYGFKIDARRTTRRRRANASRLAREAMDEVIDWLTFYNHRRLHSTLDYLSPMQFERARLAAHV